MTNAAINRFLQGLLGSSMPTKEDIENVNLRNRNDYEGIRSKEIQKSIHKMLGGISSHLSGVLGPVGGPQGMQSALADYIKKLQKKGEGHYGLSEAEARNRVLTELSSMAYSDPTNANSYKSLINGLLKNQMRIPDMNMTRNTVGLHPGIDPNVTSRQALEAMDSVGGGVRNQNLEQILPENLSVMGGVKNQNLLGNIYNGLLDSLSNQFSPMSYNLSQSPYAVEGLKNKNPGYSVDGARVGDPLREEYGN